MRQGELFGAGAALSTGRAPAAPAPVLDATQLQRWQLTLVQFQAPLFIQGTSDTGQTDLFGNVNRDSLGGDPDPAAINPLELKPQALSFWRWPQAPQQGAALYFVMDGVVVEGDTEENRETPPQPLLLYVGETGRADRRWKGEHDCKGYLAAYSEALTQVGLSCRLSIRFWLDVPAATRARRALEQQLIKRWLPPFNKETRQRWATPFTALAEGG
jgi:hypothetical protein